MIGEPIRISESFHNILDEWEESDSHYFLTGKAGTGKSTLLQLFRSTTSKKIAVLAPTGMAAIQIKGQTIHSFFQLPPRLLTPDQIDRPRQYKLMRKLDTIVIDEVSMVRADLLDAIDRSLRLARDNDQAFGGVQMILFGDPYQLPPVISTAEERAWLENHYDSPYFFDAHCLAESTVHLLQLEQVYRQADQRFIGLLDEIRSGEAGDEALEALNQCIGRKFSSGSLFVTLCSLNIQAEAINRKRMADLTGEERVFMADITGNVSPRQIPGEPVLALKEGAQVMFIKNDQRQRFVNGTLGEVTGFTSGGVLVRPQGNHGQGEEIEVEKETWESIRYRLEHGDQPRITHEVTGTFTQLPLRPAWAITIHKSQGQTYDQVAIDLGKGAFEFGQTYVALSRCRSIDGISLSRPLQQKDIMTDPRITDFFESHRWD